MWIGMVQETGTVPRVSRIRNLFFLFKNCKTVRIESHDVNDQSLWHLPVYYSWCRWPVPVTFHFNNIVFYFYVILHLRLCCIFKIINKHWALQAYRIVKRFTSWFPYMLTLMTFVIEPIDIAKPSKDARKHLWKALYLSIIMRVTLRAIRPP